MVLVAQEYHIDAGTFQTQLEKLAEVLAQKVKREAPKLIAPDFVSGDLHLLVRQAMYTYDLLFYLNADERRLNDCYWRVGYSISALPLIRNMIDCLYNVTTILQDPGVNGPWFRKSGFKKALAALNEDEAKYGGRPEWDEWIRKARDAIVFEMRRNGLITSEVLAAAPWPTMGKYISDKQPGGTTTPHQDFLETFVLGRWREYSALAHGGFEGLSQVGAFFIEDSLPHEDRPKLEQHHHKILSMHISRAAVVLLSIITELQAYFQFDGANINKRIHEIWNALMPVFEVKELYDEHYKQLMEDKGINAQ
jgi:hypothetical protein